MPLFFKFCDMRCKVKHRYLSYGSSRGENTENGEEEIKRYIRRKYPSAKETLQMEEGPLRTKQVS